MADNRVVILKRANKLFRQGKVDAAVKEYNKVLQIKSDDLEVRRIIGDLELRQNNIPEAVEQFDWIADYYLKEGFFAKAIAMYKRITRVDPNYEGANYKLADLYTKQGLVMEAKQIYLDIAEECKRQNNQKKALDMYRKILEFDRTNVKMRLLLADNYLKEGLEEQAITEYLLSADILYNKKDFRRAEELLLETIRKVKNIKLIEKLISFYAKQEEDDKAIELLQELGLEVFKNIELLKVLGELYLKKNLISEAEIVFSKIAEIDPGETEVIVRLGKVYLQREEYEKTYNLFLPIIDKNMQAHKFEEAASLLRLIIASNNIYLPALLKLAIIFKASNKTNNLIALYESLLPIYEQKGMKEEMKKVLEELIQLSDTPFGYEEQLSRLTGKQAKVIEEDESEKERERENEFINYNLRLVNEAVKVSDFNKAIDILKKAKNTFPKNLGIRKKLFELYQQTEQSELALDEGKALLEFLKIGGHEDEYTDLLGILSNIKPDDAKLVELSVNEKTSIEIDFGKMELEEEISDAHMDEGEIDENDILVLSEEENLSPPLLETDGREKSKSLSAVLSEVDFYLNDGYLGDAEQLLLRLKDKFPGNEALMAKIKKLELARYEAKKHSQSGTITSGYEFELEEPAQVMHAPMREPKAPTERIDSLDPMLYASEDSNIEINFEELENPSEFKLMDTEPPPPAHDMFHDLEMDMDMGLDMDSHRPAPQQELNFELDSGAPLYTNHQEMDLEIEPSPSIAGGFQSEKQKSKSGWENSSLLKISEEAYAATDNLPLELDEEPLSLDGHEEAFEGFEIESSIAAESSNAQEHEDSKFDMKIDLPVRQPEIKIQAPALPEDDLAFEIEVDEREEIPDVPVMKVDQDLLVQSPSSSPELKEKAKDGYTSSVIDELDLDKIIMDEESPYELDSPFKEMGTPDLGFEAEDEDLLKDEALFIEEPYLENERNCNEELEAIAIWMKELEKQRTSTIEKNMMEIFEEFKKGVDEKIGQEDYDTRYNLGIAYKEMGLLEEAIHEFLISAKHPLKFFDSAGLLGMCFREKGMFGEAINWFEKALETPDRRTEEYLAVKYEMVVTLKLKEDYLLAKQMLDEILRVSPDYRNVAQLYQEIDALIARQR